MRKRKIVLKYDLFDILKDDIIVIKNENDWIFEIGNEITSDIGEAVAILMMRNDIGDDIWDIDIEYVDLRDILPEKSLFWLTGGYKEWRDLDNYNRHWSECYLEFEKHFGYIIIDIIQKSKKLKDVRNAFIRQLNLPILYDFAISKGFIK